MRDWGDENKNRRRTHRHWLSTLPHAAVLATLLWLLSPPAHANVGAPLMLATTFYLLFGNAIIGVVEGNLIAHFFETTKRRAVLLMVPANYFSMVVGFALLNPASREGHQRMEFISTYTGLSAFLVFFVMAYVLTVFVEWPFCLFAFPRGSRKPLRALKASLLVQTVSYTLLIAWCALVSHLNPPTNGRIDASQPGVAPVYRDVVAGTQDDAVVYYLAVDGRALHRVRVNGSKPELVRELDSPWQPTGIVARTSEGEDVVALYAVNREGDEALLLPNLGPTSRVRQGESSGFTETFWPEEEEWRVVARNMPGAGLSVKNRRTGRTYRLSFETPLLRLPPSYPALLPDNRVVLQLGSEIVLLDMPTRRLAHLPQHAH